MAVDSSPSRSVMVNSFKGEARRPSKGERNVPGSDELSCTLNVGLSSRQELSNYIMLAVLEKSSKIINRTN